MISTIKKGGIFSVAIALFLIAGCCWPLFYKWFVLGELSISFLIKTILSIFLLVVQSFWLSQLLTRLGLIEQRTLWPVVVAMMVGFFTPEQFLAWEVILSNFFWLILFERTLFAFDDTQENLPLFIDIGFWFGMACLFYPKTIYLSPLIIVITGLITSVNLNKFLLAIQTFLIVVVGVLGVLWVFFPNIFNSEIHSLGFSTDFTAVLLPEYFYSYCVIAVALLLLFPVVSGIIRYVQTQSRNFVNSMVLLLIFGFTITLFSGVDTSKSAMFLSLPIICLISLGMFHMKNRLLANLFTIALVFALFMVKWAYILKMF
ncbi:MAG: hypothetical protein H6607_01870 [Flavobacteriales bacterium]|nr:hypothetical protein [Flavobacteriales bacterium]